MAWCEGDGSRELERQVVVNEGGVEVSGTIGEDREVVEWSVGPGTRRGKDVGLVEAGLRCCCRSS
jgi:hypothetical protein